MTRQQPRIAPARWLWAVLPLLIAASSPPAASVTFSVSDQATGAPVPNALVLMRPGDIVARTDTSGVARLRDVPAGAYDVLVRAIGYQARRLAVTLSGDTADIVLQLQPVAQRLPMETVEDSASSMWLREFNERRRQDRGHYITEEQLRRLHGSNFPDILERSIPGIRVGGVNDLDRPVYSTRGPNSFGGACKVAVYLDGMRLFDGNAATVPAAMLGGVEYYTPGFAPVQYREPAPVSPTRHAPAGGSAACGVLLLWTKP